LEGLDLRSAAHEHLRALGSASGHTVHLAALDGDSIVYLDKVESRQSIRMYSYVVARAPLHATGVGKAILAHIDPQERESITRTRPYGSTRPSPSRHAKPPCTAKTCSF